MAEPGVFLSPTTLTGEGFVLAPFEAGDVAVLAGHAHDHDLRVFNPGPPDGDWAGFVARRNDWSSGDHASWAIRDGAGTLLGSVSLHRLEPLDATADIGYFVLPPFRGRGWATAAVRLATRYGFTTAGLARISIYHAVDNEASCAVAHRCGYLLEGTTRSSHIYGDGRRHDEHLHARLATD